MSKLKIIIITEIGNSPKGTGHFFRSINIIESFDKKKSHIFLNNSKKNKIITKKINLNFIFYNNIHKINFKKFFGDDYVFVIDLFLPNENLIKKINKFSNKVIIFNDLNRIKNKKYNTINPQEIYNKKIIIKNNSHYFGTNYFVIKKSFLNTRKKYLIRRKVKNILICLGGAVTKKNLLIVTKFLNEVLDFNYNISISSSFNNIKNIKINRKIKIINHNSDLSKIIHKYDLSLISGGFIKFELMCIGMPIIYIPLNDHQKQLSKKFSDIGCGIFLSEINKLDSNKTQLKNKINSLINNYEDRKKMYIRNRNLVDGKAFKRINKIFKNL